MSMKQIFAILFLLCMTAPVWSQQDADIKKNTKLLVYYFHITNRCQTCTKIEATTKKILEQDYKTQIENGTIIFKSFNVDLPENKDLVKKYQAYGATLAFNYVVSEKEAGIEDLTGMAFSKINNEALFTKELKAKIDEALM